MRCQEAKRLISVFIDDELRKHDEQDLYKHLSSCSGCSKYLDEARNTDRLLKKALFHVQPQDDFAAQVMLRLDENMEHCINVEELPATASLNKSNNWVSRLTRGWLRSGVAASVALILLVGSLGLSGSASTEDSFAKRVFLGISRDGLSGIRRVVDDVISGKPDKVELPDEKPDPPPPAPTPDENQNVNDRTNEQLVPEDQEKNQIEVALRETEKVKGQKKEEEIETAAASAVPQVSMTAIVTPVAVSEGKNNMRPVWVDKNYLFYLSENKAPRDGTYVIWETNAKGNYRKILSSAGYCMTLDHGGGVWFTNKRYIAFVTNKNGYWQIGYSNLKGKPQMAVQSAKDGVTPAEGVLWEYNPVISSNGEVAYLTKRLNNIDIMAADKEGSARVITKTPEIESNPAWSPDGTKIAYFRHSGTGGSIKNAGVFVCDSYGRNTEAVTPLMSRTNMVPAWSPDGKQIAVNMNSHDDKNGLWVVNTDGTNWRKLSDKGGGKVVNWSPDGKLIAYTNKNGKLYVCETGGKGEEDIPLAIEPDDQHGAVEYVSWAPDSLQLLLEWKGEQTKTKAIWRAQIIKF